MHGLASKHKGSLERPGSIWIEVLGFAHSGVCWQIRVIPTESALRFHSYARLFLTPNDLYYMKRIPNVCPC
jgi:hypothetical protein